MSRTAALLSLLFLLSAAPANAGSWTLGAHLGAGVVSSGSDGGSSAVWAIPSNVLTYQPSVRIGFGTARHGHDAMLDLGSLVIDEAGSVLSLNVATLSYQYVFRPGSKASPFINAGLGFYREGGASDITTQNTLGAGLGVRRVLRDDHGVIRAEFRFDYLEGDDDFARSQLRTFGVRVGFDLWM